METVSPLQALCEWNPSVTVGFPSQRPVALSFDVFFNLRLNKRLSIRSRHRWFEMPSASLLHHWLNCVFPWLDEGCIKKWMFGDHYWYTEIHNSIMKIHNSCMHYGDVIMGTMVSQITGLTIVYSTVYSVQIKENIKAPRHWPVTRKMFPLMTSSWDSHIWLIYMHAYSAVHDWGFGVHCDLHVYTQVLSIRSKADSRLATSECTTSL